MSNESLESLRDAYFDEIKLYVWYTPSPFSLVKGKANKQLAAQHCISAQVAWVKYMSKKHGGK